MVIDIKHQDQYKISTLRNSPIVSDSLSALKALCSLYQLK